MKQLFTFTFIAILFLISTNSFSQVFNVPAQYPTIKAAVDAIKADEAIVAGGEVTINVAEGTIVDEVIDNITKGIKLTIQGAGADKTIIKGLELRPTPGTAEAKRFIQLNNVSNDGLELTIKGIKFLYWGFGNTNGGGVINAIADVGMKISFYDCEFEGCAARVGAILQSNKVKHEVLFNNVFVHKCLAFDNNSFNGLLNLAGTKKATIINSTFMSNEANVINKGATNNETDRAFRNGSIIAFAHSGVEDNSIILEKNVFVNNKVTDAGSNEIEQVTVSIKHGAAVEITTRIAATLIDNIFIGNKREGENLDVDVLYNDTERIDWVTPSGNIMNSFVKRIQTGVDEDGVTPIYGYVSDENEGFLKDASYTYADARINFTMDGELPKVLVDNKGVGYLEYTGDGTGGTNSTMNQLAKMDVSYLNGIVSIKGISNGETISLYNLNGMLLNKKKAVNNSVNFDVTNGNYIVVGSLGSLKIAVR